MNQFDHKTYNQEVLKRFDIGHPNTSAMDIMLEIKFITENFVDEYADLFTYLIYVS